MTDRPVKPKVFISCWYTEFSREEKLIKKALQDAGFEISEMGTFGGLMDDITKEHLKYIDQADVFVGIYGSAYGALVPTSDPSVVLDISWLELDYRKAEDLGIPVLAFIQNVRYRDERLAELLNRIVTRYGGYRFTGERTLVEGVLKAINEIPKLDRKASNQMLEILPKGKISANVFLSYASEDIESAWRLFDDLTSAGVNVWFDKKSLLPGQKWKQAIRGAIRDSRFFLALISANSVNKKGYVQKELKQALDVLEEYPQSSIYLIPARLDKSKPLDERLQDLHWVDMSADWDSGVALILKSIGSQSS